MTLKTTLSSMKQYMEMNLFFTASDFLDPSEEFYSKEELSIAEQEPNLDYEHIKDEDRYYGTKAIGLGMFLSLPFTFFFFFIGFILYVNKSGNSEDKSQKDDIYS